MQTERHGRSGLCGKAVYAGSLRSGSAEGGGVCIKGVVAGKNGRARVGRRGAENTGKSKRAGLMMGASGLKKREQSPKRKMERGA